MCKYQIKKTKKLKKDVKYIVDTVVFKDRVNGFVKQVRQETKDKGIKCILAKSSHVELNKDTKCNGYFCTATNKLVAATGKPIEQWFPVFVHEYAHFTQWRDDIPLWDYLERVEHVFWNWFGGKTELGPEMVNLAMLPIREIEKDCEMRVMNLIDEFDLPLDKKAYAKRANSYISFYNVVAKTRKWYVPGKEPYNTPEVLEVMPTRIYKDFNKVPKKILDLIEKKCT